MLIAFDLVNWASRALSLFNTIALLWLGITVLLNAERRTWGTWVIGLGLVSSGVFFVGHSALVGVKFGALSPEMEFWWRAVWLLFVVHPYMWYLVIAWYSGTLHSRSHKAWFVAVSILGASAFALLILVNPLPTYSDVLRQSSVPVISVGGLPVVILVYPVYSVLCFTLALWMLRHPGATQRFMGHLARERAHPWLLGTSVALLALGLTVGAMAAWFLRGIQDREIDLLSAQTLTTLTTLDIIVSGLISGVVILVGRAIVSYEVFTGKALPRGGLFRDWRNSLILAAGFGVFTGAILELSIDPIYHLLLATVLMTIFYALLSWRSYLERERSIKSMRPFVASQRLYENMLAQPEPFDNDVATPFGALCDNILGARVAYLTVLGPLASLVNGAYSYPSGNPVPEIAGLAGKLLFSKDICVKLDPSECGGAEWAIGLWGGRGLLGGLLLGEKRDGRLYAQEEIEIARDAGERLIDGVASAEMARRLMALQRQRLVESQIVDQSARKVLHDEVLPVLHAALLELNADISTARDSVRNAVVNLAEAHRRIADLMQTMPATSTPDVARLGLVGTLRRALEKELGTAFDGWKLEVDLETERQAWTIPKLTAEVIFGATREAIRNAARHGRGAQGDRPLHLSVSIECDSALRVLIDDDGIGLGTGGTQGPSSGQGLTLHSTMMAVIGGTLTAENLTAGGTRVTLALPIEGMKETAE
ncbi:MAG: hypothetical protein HYY30_09830 [Chloroflexi bacterium]|nr:hypothetical protein [Chloroflexota bacterium]